jgi:hydrogenase maturation protease
LDYHVERTLIIGYGNPLRGDDAVGWLAAQRLAESPDAAHTDVRVLQQLSPELAEPLARARRVIFIDACDGGLPGTVTWQPLDAALEPDNAFTHRLTPASLLASARQLYGRAPAAVVITIAGESFDYGETLSPAVGQALPQVVRLVTTMVDD